ncbi:unnamed protein product [Boreogadus saida]
MLLQPPRRNWTWLHKDDATTGPRDPPYIPPLTPSSEVPRSHDPDFALKNRLILAAIKATHHLANVTGPEPLPVIARLAASLMASIRPAVPTPRNPGLLEDSARYWAHTTSTILRDHYRATVVQKPSFSSTSGLPHLHPETLDRDGRAGPLSVPGPRFVSLFSFLSLLLPFPLSLPLQTRGTPSGCRTLSAWRTTRTVTKLRCPKPPATPWSTQTLVQPSPRHFPTTSASGFHPRLHPAPPADLYAPPADGVTPDNSPPECPPGIQSQLLRLPARHLPPCVCPDQRLRPALDLRHALQAQLLSLTPSAPRQTFTLLPADNVTLDTPTRLSIKAREVPPQGSRWDLWQTRR